MLLIIYINLPRTPPSTGTKQLGGGSEGEITLRIHRGGGNNSVAAAAASPNRPPPRKKVSRFAKEAKAAKTLGTVMGVLVADRWRALALYLSAWTCLIGGISYLLLFPRIRGAAPGEAR